MANGVGELRPGGPAIDLRGGDGAVGEDRNDIPGHLDEPAIDVEGLGGPARFDPHLAVSQPTDKRTVIGGDADFAVKQRQSDKLGILVQGRLFGGNDNAMQCSGHYCCPQSPAPCPRFSVPYSATSPWPSSWPAPRPA